MVPSPHLEWLADGDLLSVPGWRGAGIRTGVKESGAPDLALFQADSPRHAAAVFTRNELPAACVLLGREAMARRPELRTLCVNSGNANAMTGAQGRADAERIVELVERHAGGPALAVSTGIIGVPLPMELVEPGIEEEQAGLKSANPFTEGFLDVDRAAESVFGGTQREIHHGHLTLLSGESLAMVQALAHITALKIGIAWRAVVGIAGDHFDSRQKISQCTDRGGFPSATVTHDHHGADAGIDHGGEQRKLHFVLTDHGGEREDSALARGTHGRRFETVEDCFTGRRDKTCGGVASAG